MPFIFDPFQFHSSTHKLFATEPTPIDDKVKEWAEQGDIDAQKSLANCYLNGDGVKKDYVQAVKWLEVLLTDKEWDWWDIQMGWKLVDCYSEGGHGLEPNYSKAEKWLKKIVETNNKYWHWDRLRDFYFKGMKEFEPSPIKGFEWLKKWAEQGYVRAQNELAECYFQGIGIEKKVVDQTCSLVYYKPHDMLSRNRLPRLWQQ